MSLQYIPESEVVQKHIAERKDSNPVVWNWSRAEDQPPDGVVIQVENWSLELGPSRRFARQKACLKVNLEVVS